jgi:predicted ATPase
MTTALPSGIVTFLFTDIEGSTRRWEADADAMRVALEAHNRVLREAIEAHEGHVFNYTGDGMCAVFTSPRSAVDAAIAAQRALELPVRMGIGTGEAELRGGEYFGTVLNRTARVMAAGHGGQILIDGATAGLLSGVDLISLGPRRLRDIAKPVDVFQARAAGLRSDFPPLKTVDSTPGNLRARTTSFIGRETELAELEEVLKSHQLVTLTGVGGVGKTRLALEVGARLADNFLDGVFMIELAAVGDPAAVPDAVAAVLGIIQQPGISLTDSLSVALEDRSRLLIFDNCEHLLDAAADVIEAILARSDTVKILATSREGLGIEDEQLWPVSSLDTNTGVDSSAASLFFDRAHTVARGVSLTPRDAVVEICQRLDGIPLAIELAASRMQSMTATELRDRLDDRFRLLVGSRRGLERHHTLRQAVQWSYDLLDDAEKTLLARCSVFAGGFDLAGACAVGGSDDDFATLHLLDALVRKSLLVADRSSDRTRFSMLETIRQFAEDQLVSTGQADAARTVHGRYFAARENDVLALWDSPRQREAYTWFTLEIANLRAAFRWAADHDELDAAATIAFYAAFVGYWLEQFEPVGWAAELIEPARTVQHRRLAQLYMIAAVCFVFGRLDEAVRYADAGQAAIASRQFDEVPYEFTVWTGGAYVAEGRPERWVDLCRNMIEHDPGTHEIACACLALAFNVIGANNESAAASEGMLGVADATNNPQVACTALLSYGVGRRGTDPAGARKVLRRALRIAEESGNIIMQGHMTATLSRLTATHGEPAEAFEYVALSIRNFYDAGSFSLVYSPLAILTALFDRLGNYEPAATISGFAASGIATYALDQIDQARAELPD